MKYRKHNVRCPDCGNKLLVNYTDKDTLLTTYNCKPCNIIMHVHYNIEGGVASTKIRRHGNSVTPICPSCGLLCRSKGMGRVCKNYGFRLLLWVCGRCNRYYRTHPVDPLTILKANEQMVFETKEEVSTWVDELLNRSDSKHTAVRLPSLYRHDFVEYRDGNTRTIITKKEFIDVGKLEAVFDSKKWWKSLSPERRRAITARVRERTIERKREIKDADDGD